MNSQSSNTLRGSNLSGISWTEAEDKNLTRLATKHHPDGSDYRTWEQVREIHNGKGWQRSGSSLRNRWVILEKRGAVGGSLENVEEQDEDDEEAFNVEVGFLVNEFETYLSCFALPSRCYLHTKNKNISSYTSQQRRKRVRFVSKSTFLPGDEDETRTEEDIEAEISAAEKRKKEIQKGIEERKIKTGVLYGLIEELYGKVNVLSEEDGKVRRALHEIDMKIEERIKELEGLI